MATEPILAALDVSAMQARRIASSSVLFDYWELTKPEINFLIAITAAAGFWMGSPAAPPHFPWMPFIHTLLGTVFVASGAANPEPADRVAVRCANAPNRAAAARLGTNCSFACFVVRSFVVRFWCRVSCHFDERPCVFAGRTHSPQLLVFVYAAKTDHSSMYPGRRDPGRRTTVDRLGSSAWAS